MFKFTKYDSITIKLPMRNLEIKYYILRESEYEFKNLEYNLLWWTTVSMLFITWDAIPIITSLDKY